MVIEYLLKKTLDAALERAKKFLIESSSKLVSTRLKIEQSINIHVQSVNKWSEQVSFTDLKKAKYTTDIFIELDLFVYPRRVRIQPDEKVGSIPLKKIFDNSVNHFILLGQPGAGKTTSTKYFCQLLFHNEDFYRDKFSFPILIRFRELNNLKEEPDTVIIIDQIFNILGLNIDWPEQLRESEAAGERRAIAANERRAIKEKLVITVLNELKVLVILDGFDELSQGTERTEALNIIQRLATHLHSSTMIVTSRSGDFIYNINNTVQYEISPLSKDQIAQFALRWLIDEEKASDFLEKVYLSPFADTAVRPLTLAHLCAIYERLGKIPDKPKTIYKKVVYLLLEEWDQQRSVKRNSRYASFEVDRKFEFLCRLAYELTTWLQQTVFSKDDLYKVYIEIYSNYDLKMTEAQQVVAEVETHTGLLLQSGYEQFEFAHKSLQEYLTAEYLVRLPSIPTEKHTLQKLPNELAIAISISSNPSEYLAELVINRLMSIKLHSDFMKIFLSRLLLEKPDFNTSDYVFVSLISLYTIYMDWMITNSNHFDLYSSDNLIKEFEALIKTILHRNSTGLISNHYEITHTYERPDGDNVHFMARKRILDDSSLIPINLPKSIYIKSSFLERSEN